MDLTKNLRNNTTLICSVGEKQTVYSLNPKLVAVNSCPSPSLLLLQVSFCKKRSSSFHVSTCLFIRDCLIAGVFSVIFVGPSISYTTSFEATSIFYLQLNTFTACACYFNVEMPLCLTAILCGYVCSMLYCIHIIN